MIIEDERDVNVPIRDARPSPTNVEMTINEDMRFQQFLACNLHIKDKEVYL